MIYISDYDSPLGSITIAVTEEKLVGIWFHDQKYYMQGIKNYKVNHGHKMILKTKKWLEDYFTLKNPSVCKLELELEGSDFRKAVYEALLCIPYGETRTYKEIALSVGKRMNKSKMSSQAVGNAIGHNPISIVIPCHRVIGSNGKLIGYAGGISKKEWLLQFEKETTIS